MQTQQRLLECRVSDLQQEAEQMSKDKVQETQSRLKMEEELSKYLKTHEDEVNLRLRFEEKLNNLHALNKVQN